MHWNIKQCMKGKSFSRDEEEPAEQPVFQNIINKQEKYAESSLEAFLRNHPNNSLNLESF